MTSKPQPETIHEEPEPSPDKVKSDSPERLPAKTIVQRGRPPPQTKDTGTVSTTPREYAIQSRRSTPELPFTWKFAVSSPSSFEKALDEVVRKLDQMEEEGSPAYIATTATKENYKPPQKEKLPKSATPREKLCHAAALRRRRLASEAASSATGSSVPSPAPTPLAESAPETKPAKPEAKSKVVGAATMKADSLSAEDVTVDHADRDISDRDVLKGLRMAISAACDEDLDVWIRGRTGLRLRRFLADLKTFEDLGGDDDREAGDEDRRGAGKVKGERPDLGNGLGPGLADGQRARTRRAEKRRVEDERERKRQAVLVRK